jgi:hypothetical protein
MFYIDKIKSCLPRQHRRSHKILDQAVDLVIVQQGMVTLDAKLVVEQRVMIENLRGHTFLVSRPRKATRMGQL